MDKLGIQFPVLITQVINFGILLFVLNKFLYKPVLKALEARKQKIADSLSHAKELESDKEKFERKKQELLRDAKDEAGVIIANAKKDAKAAREEIITEARQDAQKLRTKMEKELKEKYDEMHKSLSEQTIDVASKMVEKLLTDALSKEDQAKLIERQLKRVKAVRS